MEKREAIEAEEIIQHVQSFLSGKEAARTTLLSKSWNEAWLTRPNLDFSERDFGTPLFEKFANKTLQRYDELNRRIQSFKLSMDVCKSGNTSLAKELIVKALKLGAINLNLSRVYIESNIFWDIISTCPLIEELSLSECKSGPHTMLVLEPGLGACDFRKLKVLNLKEIGIGECLFHEFSLSRFPCLEELALQDCTSYEKIQICSNSLKSLSITQTSTNMLQATLDVPRIRKFKFSGLFLPPLSFKTVPTGREWESDITITINSFLLKFSWFYELNKFLLELSSSKISLYLSTDTSCCVYETEGVTWVSRKPPVAVEKLTLAPNLLHCASFLDGLFTSCDPGFINLPGLSSWFVQGKSNNDLKELLCNKTLIKERSMLVLHDLEEVNVEDALIEGVNY